MPNNSLYKVVPGLTQQPLASDFNQFVDAMNGINDIGQITFAASILAPSSAGATATAAVGTTMGIGTFLYKITYVVGYIKSNALRTIVFGNETDGSASFSVTTTSGNQAVNLAGLPTAWPSRVVAMRIYRTSVGGADGTQKLVATLTTPIATYADTMVDGSLGVAIPTVNTTGTDIAGITVDPTQAPSGLAGTMKQFFSWIANRIKAITGTTNWYDAPRTTLANAVMLNGDTMGGVLTSKPTVGAIGDATGSKGTFEVRGNGTATDAAFAMFHRPGSYAAYFGIDTDNKWKVGGYSAGANAYQLWHSGNQGSGSGMDTDLVHARNIMQSYSGGIAGSHADAVGMTRGIMWRNFADHMIFDASNGAAPNGTAISNTDSQNRWTATHGSLMGWNGSQTYGVRVDRARDADYAGGVQIRQNGVNIEWNNGGVWTPVSGYGAAKPAAQASTASTTTVTLLSVTGMGALNMFGSYSNAGGALNVIADGVTIFSVSPYTTQYYHFNDGATSNTRVLCHISFEKTLQITGWGATAYWQYELV